MNVSKHYTWQYLSILENSHGACLAAGDADHLSPSKARRHLPWRRLVGCCAGANLATVVLAPGENVAVGSEAKGMVAATGNLLEK